MSTSRLSKAGVVALTTSGISLVVGTLFGHLLTKKYVTDKYESLIEEEVLKAKAFYSQLNKTGEFSDPAVVAERLGAKAEQADETVTADEEDIVVDDKPFRDLDPEVRVNYSKYSENYTGPAVQREKPVQDPPLEINTGESMAEFETRIAEAAHEKVAAIINDVEEGLGEEGENMASNVFDTHGVEPLRVDNEEDRASGQPYIISVSEFMENDPQYSQNTISYYQGDSVLADDSDQPIPDINSIVGERNLQRFGEGSGDPNIVFVRNDRLEVDFEITQSLGTYAEEVLGVTPQQARGRGSR
ncbi:hypothetical protein SEA_RICKMORE_56 [Gordonia phage Rickmore]|uniref:Uncharacterized protein n=1 Tax=Gordonia phage Rickmore TaxID=2507854 RepID=A0A410TB58_9CAUD|nr:hypothetical protein HWC05_gp56 [Gordonia phage Rickmore]QAU06290.1 hypothetical protein SEA_RICKMORE_56 [Gordonia phage Rickmore]